MLQRDDSLIGENSVCQKLISCGDFLGLIKVDINDFPSSEKVSNEDRPLSP
jgi:hypothetical protein